MDAAGENYGKYVCEQASKVMGRNSLAIMIEVCLKSRSRMMIFNLIQAAAAAATTLLAAFHCPRAALHNNYNKHRQVSERAKAARQPSRVVLVGT